MREEGRASSAEGEDLKDACGRTRPGRIFPVVICGGRLGASRLTDQHSPPVALPESCTSQTGRRPMKGGLNVHGHKAAQRAPLPGDR